MAKRNRSNRGTDEEALTSDEKRPLSPEVEEVRDRFFGDDPDEDRRGGGQ